MAAPDQHAGRAAAVASLSSDDGHVRHGSSPRGLVVESSEVKSSEVESSEVESSRVEPNQEACWDDGHARVTRRGGMMPGGMMPGTMMPGTILPPGRLLFFLLHHLSQVHVSQQITASSAVSTGRCQHRVQGTGYRVQPTVGSTRLDSTRLDST